MTAEMWRETGEHGWPEMGTSVEVLDYRGEIRVAGYWFCDQDGGTEWIAEDAESLRFPGGMELWRPIKKKVKRQQ